MKVWSWLTNVSDNNSKNLDTFNKADMTSCVFYNSLYKMSKHVAAF